MRPAGEAPGASHDRVCPDRRRLGVIAGYLPTATRTPHVRSAWGWLTGLLGFTLDDGRDPGARRVPAVPARLYSGNNAVFPRDAKAQHGAAPNPDKRFAMVKGADHYGVPLAGVTTNTRAEVLSLLTSWLRERFSAG